MQEKADLENRLSEWQNDNRQFNDNVELLELAQEENDSDLSAEAEANLYKLEEILQKKQLANMLSGEADRNSCYLELHSGAGGTESQDWAEMLLRMYRRWGERREFKVEIIEATDGDEAGIKSATLRIDGVNAYGWIKTEEGVHRLVRISPFDANSRRHTSFCSVSTYPVLEDDINIEIEDKDLRIDTYRASGAGGQHVNRTDSAVRITHIPSSIVVACQNDRSQHKNRATAMKMLKAKLYEKELNKREEANRKEYEAKSDIAWGHQIRSYVLHPYQMVKDLRTNIETGNSKAVLDGDIDIFLEASLQQKLLASPNNSK